MKRGGVVTFARVTLNDFIEIVQSLHIFDTIK